MQEALRMNECLMVHADHKMITVPIFLTPAVSSLRSLTFQLLQHVKSRFCLRDFAASVPFVQKALALDSHVTDAFSLFRDQPKHYSPRRLSRGSLLKAVSLSFPSDCPVLLTSKHLLLSEMICLIDLWLVHFLSLLEGQEISCLAHCFIYSIWCSVSCHPTIVE